jgi:cytidylate kinase
MAVITFSREMGSGGTALGRILARRLEYALVDKELILRVARRARVSEQAVARYDQEDFRKGESLLEGLFAGNPISYAALTMGASFPAEVGAAAALVAPFNQKRYLAATQRLLRALARKGKVILMGRGGQLVLAGQKRTLHLRVVAPLEQRVKRVRRRLKLSEPEALKAISCRDQACARYLKYFYHRDWNDPWLYDLVLNTGRVSLSQAVEIIISLLKEK